ncbi:transposase [Sinorhizobium meliloti]|uniref:transposase n=1 Tax=Rhizobium meliloti TaxID=382 RepID=UPI0002E469B5|nr:transposase [Sinorhizobium meliloti]MDE4587256.1 transposase [Sinorhizobium meliloti]
MSDSVNQPRTFEVLTAAPVRARRKPRDWPNEEKERLIAETLLPGANVSAIARAEGLDPSQLYGWRRKALSSGLVAPLTETAKKEVKFARVEPVASSAVEIVLAGHIGRQDTSGPFAINGASGRSGLEEDPANQGQTAVADGLNRTAAR